MPQTEQTPVQVVDQQAGGGPNDLLKTFSKSFSTEITLRI